MVHITADVIMSIDIEAMIGIIMIDIIEDTPDIDIDHIELIPDTIDIIDHQELNANAGTI